MTTIKVGIAGLGYWGPNLAAQIRRPRRLRRRMAVRRRPGRARARRPEHPVRAADGGPRRPARRSGVRRDRPRHAGARPTPRLRGPGSSRRASTASSRSRSRRTSSRAERAVAVADAADRILMVGHLLEYHPAVAKLKEIAGSGELGDIHYIYSHRLNLGKLRADRTRCGRSARTTSPSCSISPARSRTRSRPAASPTCARDRGRRLRLPAFPVRPGRPSAPLVARPAQGAPLHDRRRPAGWRRSTTWTWSARSRSSTRASTSPPARGASTSRTSGDIHSPAIPNREPLKIECEHCVDVRPRGPDAALRRTRSGLRVVRVLAGLQASLDASRRVQRAAV